VITVFTYWLVFQWKPLCSNFNFNFYLDAASRLCSKYLLQFIARVARYGKRLVGTA
jgi:hypothetical protein